MIRFKGKVVVARDALAARIGFPRTLPEKIFGVALWAIFSGIIAAAFFVIISSLMTTVVVFFGIKIIIHSPPVLQIVLCAVLIFFIVFSLRYFYKKYVSIRAKLVPKSFNSPLEPLGITVCHALLPPLLILLFSSDSVTKKNKDKIIFRCKQWGLSELFVTEYIDEFLEKIKYGWVEASEKNIELFRNIFRRQTSNPAYMDLATDTFIKNIKDEVEYISDLIDRTPSSVRYLKMINDILQKKNH